MICTKCGWPILIGPGGCACTRVRSFNEQMRRIHERAERDADLLIDAYENLLLAKWRGEDPR